VPAIPGTGWAFKQWSILGNVVTQNPTTVLVDQHVSATVTFEEVALEISSVDASDPTNAKLHVAIAGAFDRVECVAPGGTQVFSNVSDDIEVAFSQNYLPTGTFTFEVSGFVGEEVFASDSCTATKSAFSHNSYVQEAVWPYFMIEGVGATRVYWHGLSEEYGNIAYSVQYSGKTAIVRDFRSYLNVDSDFGTVDYTDMHRYEYGSSEFTGWQAMGPVSGGAGHPTTVYKLGSMGANGAYISPVNLTGVADISNIIMTLPEGNQPALTIANSQVDRSIP